MKRIIAALKGKVEKIQMERKINRVNRAIESATDNARDEIDRIEEEKMNIVSTLTDTSEVNGVINSLSDLIDKQEEQEAIILLLEKVKAYLADEITVED